MLDSDLILLEESELPPLTDAVMLDEARRMGEEYRLYKEARSVLENEIWPACDRAWHCIRDDYSRVIPTMKFVDNGMLGESDVREAIKAFRNQVIGGIMPTDESWLRPAPLNDEDDDTSITKIQDYLIHLNEIARTRAAGDVFADQLFVRGTSALGVRWDRIRSVRRVPRDLALTMEDIAEQLNAVDPETGEPVRKIGKKVKFWTPVRNRPVVYPIDMYRLLFDPKAELGLDTDIPMVYIMFKNFADLKYAEDESGEKLYDQEALEDCEEWTYEEWYAENPMACESTRLMGIDPSLDTQGKFLPVWLFHKLIRESEDGSLRWVDKFFYVTRSAGSDVWRIIRVQDNPSDYGDKPFYPALCDQWLSVPYGTGLAEKSLSAWKAKNLISAVGLNAKVISIFPPYSYMTGVLKDDKAGPKWQPGRGNEIIMKQGVGMNWIEPFPFNPNNVMISMQDERQYAEKIVAQTGVTSAGLVSDPGKSLAKEKTATEVRQVTTDGAMAQQTLVDRLSSDVIKPVQQCLYNYARQYVTDDERFVKKNYSGSDVEITSGKITPDEIDRDRSIEIVGRRGLANKANLITNLLEALRVLGNQEASAVLQNLPIILQDVLFKLLGQLGVPLKPEYKTPPEMLAAQTPQAQIAALQGALQNPELRQQIAQMLLASPEGEQFVSMLVEMMHAHHANVRTALATKPEGPSGEPPAPQAPPEGEAA